MGISLIISLFLNVLLILLLFGACIVAEDSYKYESLLQSKIKECVSLKLKLDKISELVKVEIDCTHI